MPIYVYKCTECNEYCEALQKASDEPLKTCPNCQAEALTKVIAPVGVIFKGTGFHKNDYSGKSGGSSSSKPAAESTASADSSSSDSKSESKTESKAATDSGGGTTGGSDKVA
ncbi:FmdB family transcriptional regulator [bacterium]|nr:FmdB family transcriptional regulator [bacterium]